jgi:hypothetical protein
MMLVFPSCRLAARGVQAAGKVISYMYLLVIIISWRDGYIPDNITAPLLCRGPNGLGNACGNLDGLLMVSAKGSGLSYLSKHPVKIIFNIL